MIYRITVDCFFMFIGHYAVAFLAKKSAPRTSLGTLFVGVQFLDILWPLFLLLGWEHARIVPGITAVSPFDFYDYPLSHSLLGSLGWSVAAGGVYYLLRRERRGAFVLACCVFSHWVLDALVHRPDLPLAWGSTIYVGLGLWNSMWGTLTVEIGLYVVGVLLYFRSTRAIDKIGNYGLVGLVVFLLAVYLASIFSGPPPDMGAVALAGNAGWLIVIWGFWVDRHRTVRVPKMT